MEILENEEMVRSLRDIAVNHRLNVFILFGSRAKTSYRKDSDYDFAFLAPANFTYEDEIRLFDTIMAELESETIDLVNIATNFDVKLRYEIFFGGVPLYEARSSLFNELKHKAWMDYMDFQRFTKNRSAFLKRDIASMQT